MKKQFILLTTVLVAVFFIYSSCQKEGDNTPALKTKTQLLTQSSWKFQSATFNGADISASPQVACATDNTMAFTPTLYTVTEGSVSCSPSTATPPAGMAWSFQSGETQLTLATILVPGTTSGTFNIVSLTETTLVISQNVTTPIAGLVVLTFKH